MCCRRAEACRVGGWVEGEAGSVSAKTPSRQSDQPWRADSFRASGRRRQCRQVRCCCLGRVGRRLAGGWRWRMELSWPSRQLHSDGRRVTSRRVDEGRPSGDDPWPVGQSETAPPSDRPGCKSTSRHEFLRVQVSPTQCVLAYSGRLRLVPAPFT